MTSFLSFTKILVRKLDNICWDEITVHDQQIKSWMLIIWNLAWFSQVHVMLRCKNGGKLMKRTTFATQQSGQQYVIVPRKWRLLLLVERALEISVETVDFGSSIIPVAPKCRSHYTGEPYSFHISLVIEITPRSQYYIEQKAAKVSDTIGHGAIGAIGASGAKEWC